MASQDSQVIHENHLVHETSPYLLQHAHNPVDWYPWHEEALSRARDENKPIFLSIGYSSCHWCHVMERESFEDEEIAQFLNEHFVSIKVDREERPDLDEIYMAAVQLMTGGGGWPMTAFLTPELKPFYGGTYFPPSDMFGRPGFLTVLKGVAAAWDEKQHDILHSAETITEAIQRHLGGPMPEDENEGARPDAGSRIPETALTSRVYDKAARELAALFDAAEGGFGPAPKFPPTPAIAFLLRHFSRTHEPSSLRMATITLDKMASGGICDQLGGGFHRYATDDQWLVPHFEKMLYDNAQLASVYLEAFQLTQRDVYKKVASRIFKYVLRDMTDDSGGFCSAEDADSEGEEGRHYLWTHDEILSLVGREEADLFCAHYGLKPGSNFAFQESPQSDASILHVAIPVDEMVSRGNLSAGEIERRLDRVRAILLNARGRRPRPARDDKIITSWNALMISAFAQGYQIIEDPRYKAAAEMAAESLLSRFSPAGELQRSYRQGIARQQGFLDDYAFTVAALLDLHEATFDLRWFDAAHALARKMIDLFWDARDGGFYFAAPRHGKLIAQSKPVHDGAEPSANAVAVAGLFRLGHLAGEPDFHEKARRTIERNLAMIARMPRVFLTMLNAAESLLAPPREIALVGSPGKSDMQGLLRALHRQFIPNKIIALLDPGKNASSTAERIPLLRSKEMVSGKATAYVCRDFTCLPPVTDPGELVKLLKA